MAGFNQNGWRISVGIRMFCVKFRKLGLNLFKIAKQIIKNMFVYNRCAEVCRTLNHIEISKHDECNKNIYKMPSKFSCIIVINIELNY